MLPKLSQTCMYRCTRTTFLAQDFGTALFWDTLHGNIHSITQTLYTTRCSLRRGQYLNLFWKWRVTWSWPQIGKSDQPDATRLKPWGVRRVAWYGTHNGPWHEDILWAWSYLGCASNPTGCPLAIACPNHLGLGHSLIVITNLPRENWK
jgi:hypothetical protein